LNGDLAEDRGVSRAGAGGAVPATVAELFATLSDGEMCRVRHARHGVRLQAAETPLSGRQTGRVVTDRTGPHQR